MEIKQNKNIFEIMAEVWKGVEDVAEDVLVWLNEKYDERGRRRQEVDNLKGKMKKKEEVK